MSKFIPQLSVVSSPFTKRHEIISGRLGFVHDGEGNIIQGSWEIDRKDCAEFLEWLDYKMPLLCSTKSLEKAANDMRTALHEIMEAVEE